MATARDVARFRGAQEELERALRRDVRALWRRVAGEPPGVIRDSFVRIMPTLVAKYGEAAAATGADFFEGLTGVRAVVGPPVQEEAVAASVRAFAGNLWEGNPNAFVDGAIASGTRHMLQPGRSTVAESTGRARGWGYARVPEAGACSWCLMLSSRGAVYATEQSAGAGNDYHDNCYCTPVPAQSWDDVPYDVNALWEKYLEARDHAGVGSDGYTTDKEITAAMRDLFGLK